MLAWTGLRRAKPWSPILTPLAYLEKIEDRKIQVPIGDRSGVVIEPMLTDQWYVNAEELAKDAIKAMDAGHVTNTPAHSREGGNPEQTSDWTPAVAGESGEGGATRFIPENWKKTWDQWMNNIEPWCISRQLWWGHRVPVWYGPNLSQVPKMLKGENLKKFESGELSLSEIAETIRS